MVRTGATSLSAPSRQWTSHSRWVGTGEEGGTAVTPVCAAALCCDFGAAACQLAASVVPSHTDRLTATQLTPASHPPFPVPVLPHPCPPQNLDSSEISLTDVSHYFDSDPTKLVQSLRTDGKGPNAYIADTTTANGQVRCAVWQLTIACACASRPCLPSSQMTTSEVDPCMLWLRWGKANPKCMLCVTSSSARPAQPALGFALAQRTPASKHHTL